MAELGRTFIKQALARVTAGNEGARLIGAQISGVAGSTVQAMLEGLKTLVDTKADSTDSRLSNTRTPTDATVTNAKVATGAAIEEAKLALASDAAAATASRRTLGTGATQAAAGNDSRLTNARTPTAHKSTHATGGTDVLAPADIGAIAATEKGAASGVASLDAQGKLLDTQTNKTSITSVSVVATQAAMLALTAEEGDIAVRTDENKTYALRALPATTLANWELLRTPTDVVTSVHGRSGAVAAAPGDYNASQITNTPAGNIAATTVQAALGELDSEKVDTADARLSNARTPTAHKSSHEPGGSDALAVDAVAATGSLRTLGSGGQQASPGNHAHAAATQTIAGFMSEADKTKLDGLSSGGGAADGSTTVKGVFEAADAAEVQAGTATGATGAVLVVTADALKAELERRRNMATQTTGVVNNNATANTLQDIPQLTFPIAANQVRRFYALIVFDAAATTTGARFTLTGPASPTRVAYSVRVPLTATTMSVQFLSAYDGGTPSASSLATANIAVIEGVIDNGATAGNVVLRFASEIASSGITVRPGSMVEWW